MRLYILFQILKKIIACFWLILIFSTIKVNGQNFEFKFQKNSEYFNIKHFDQACLGKYLITQFSFSTKDSLLVIDVANKRPIKMEGMYGALQNFYLAPKQDLLLINTGESSYMSTSLQCFIYNTLTMKLNKAISINAGFEKLLGVDDSSMFVINYNKEILKYNLTTGLQSNSFKTNIPDDYFLNNVYSSIQNGIFTSVVYTKEKRAKTYWYNISTGEQKLTELPQDFVVFDFASYKDTTKWFLSKNKDYKMITSLDIATGNITINLDTTKFASKLIVHEETGDLLIAGNNKARLWERKGDTYQKSSVDIPIGDVSVVFAKKKNTLLTTDYFKLWLYNIDTKNEIFSISRQMDSKVSETFKLAINNPQKNEAFYVQETDEYFKFSAISLNNNEDKLPNPLHNNLASNKNSNTPHLVIQDGHQANTTDIVFSKVNGWMISGDESGEIIFWDLKSKMQIKKIKLSPDFTNTGDGNTMHLALHPNKNLIAVSWNYNTILWIDFDGNVVNQISTEAQSNIIHFSEDGKYFFYEKNMNKMAVLNMENNSISALYDFSTINNINNFSFNGNSTKIALPSKDGTVRIIDALKGIVIQEVKTANKNKINLVTFHPTIDVIATLGLPLEVCLTNLTTNKTNVVLSKAPTGIPESVWCLLFTNKGELILPGSLGTKTENGSIHNLLSAKYNLTTNYTADWQFYNNNANIAYIKGAVADNDGKTIWTVSTNNAIDIWDIETKSHIKALKGNKENITSVLVGTNFNGLLLGTEGSNNYLKKINFGNADFKVIDGMHFGNNNLFLNQNDTFSTTSIGTLKQIDLQKEIVLSEIKIPYSKEIGITPLGLVIYENGALKLIKNDGTATKLIYNFKADEDKYYFWEKDNYGKTYRFNENKNKLYLFDFKKFWCFNLLTGEKTIYQSNDIIEQVNAFEVLGEDLLLACKNTLYLYHFSNGALTPLKSFLKQRAIFSNSFYRPLLVKSSSGKLAISYILDSLKTNEANIQQVEVVSQNDQKGLIIPFVRSEPIINLLFGQDEKQLYIIYKKQIDIIDLLKNKLIATFATIPGGKYIVYTPDGYYFASPKFTEVGFNINNKIYDITQFDVKFNRPDIILERLGYAEKELIDIYKKAYQKRLQRLGIDENKLELSAEVPQLSITNRSSIALITSNLETLLKIKITKGSKNLNKLFVTINDIPLFGMNGLKLEQGKEEILVEQKIAHTAGINKIRIYATDAVGFESLKEVIEINYTPITNTPSKLWYVGIGVSKYKDSTMNLKYADKDITDLNTIFKDQYHANTKILLNEEVTLNEFKKLKDDLKKTNIEDVVVISLSGHGIVNKDGNFYYAGYATDFKNPESTGISFEKLEWLLDSIPARKKLLMIDACHSGELDKNINIKIKAPMLVGVKEIKGVELTVSDQSASLQNSYELMKELFTDLSQKNGAEVISAAGGLEYAFENKKYNNGIFTYCLKRALLENAADANGNKQVTVSELKTFMIREVLLLTGGRQKPTVRQETIDSDWQIWQQN